MIERQNILDLIGKNKSKYSSCIITSYTFDFTFFEERIMSILRTSNIKNVNVFLDGKYLEQYLENTNGNEFKTHKTYSLNPIYATGVFHPKIMLLTGPKHGLLIVGSGNLTSSGLSTNDEIWGAFHLYSIDSPNAPIFATVWNYLQEYFTQAKGFNVQKLGWITQRSPWLNDINGLANNRFISLNKEIELKFIGNTKDISSYQELLDTLPNKKINKLTIISPYFDEQGKVIEQFITDLKIGQIECVSDSDFGLLPIKLNDKLYKSVKFYDWKDCLKDFDKRFNRLHAKIFHFEFEDGWEYILIGSANATINALGSKTLKPSNAEAGILLRREIQKGYLLDLGLNLKKIKPIDVRSFIKHKNIIGDTCSSVKYEYRIINTEINGSKLSIYLKNELSKECELVILNSSNIEIERHSISGNAKEITISIEHTSEAYKVFISEREKRISYYSLIHNVALQSKCNPDPNHAEIGQIIDALSNDPENGQFIELLSYADYNWVDEELDGFNKKKGNASDKKNKPDQSKVYETISEEEFYKLNSIQSNESDLLNNPSVQIADFLNILSRGLIKTNKNIKESIEEAQANQSIEEQYGEGEEIEQTIAYNVKGELEKKAILNHLDEVSWFYSNQLKELYCIKSFRSIPKRSMTIKDLSNISIALDLMCIYFGKKYAVNKTEFVLNFDEISFVENILNFVLSNSLDDTKKYLKKHNIVIKDFSEKYFTKENLITYIKTNNRNILNEYVKKKEDKYFLKRLDKTNPNYKNWVYYCVSADLFGKMKDDLGLISPKLLVEQSEYSLITFFEEYLPQGIYNSDHGYGSKQYLIEMLGSFLLNANSIAGFKKYTYEVINDRVVALRKSIFEHAVFLCVNINWNEREYKYRDILLLDLLHFIYPNTLTNKEIDSINKSLNSTFDKTKYKCPNYNNNINYFTNTLLPNYFKCKHIFKTDPNESIKVVKSGFFNELIYSKEIGFSFLRSGGADFIIIEKPGLEWDSNLETNALKIGYPESQIKYYS